MRVHARHCQGVFPSVRKFEAELISWVLHLLHADSGSEGSIGTSSACGLLTSGGTESVLLAALSYRELGLQRGVATEYMSPMHRESVSLFWNEVDEDQS